MSYEDNGRTMLGFGAFGVLGLLFLGLLLLFGCWSIVPPGHRGVSVTLGKVDPVARGEGLTFKKPFMESIIKMPVQQITQGGTASSFSSDLQTVQVSYAVLYRIPETKVVELFQQYAGNPYATLVEPRVQEAVKQVTALYKAEELVKSREKIKQTVLGKVQQELAGLIDVRDIPITNIDLTDELERAIELKQVTEQQALAKEYELQKARKEAEITLVNAKAEAESVKIKGEALANSPRVIDLEIVKKWDGKTPQSVVTGQGGSNIILPLR
ncbi:MAG: prohibitin family protein [Candidatus Methylacidiphilales bacterium]|nr:prohibitin family protein [Candidatus Methylacidiphilales bacterium]